MLQAFVLMRFLYANPGPDQVGGGLPCENAELTSSKNGTG
jgi:hypothetical protein